MKAENFSEKDRALLLQALQQFRLHDDESDSNYDNRDELERKLQFGGEFTELDEHVLLIVVANEIEDDDIVVYFNRYLRD